MWFRSVPASGPAWPPSLAAFHEWNAPVEDDLERLRELADQCRGMALTPMAEELDCHIVLVERERREATRRWPANDDTALRKFTNRS